MENSQDSNAYIEINYIFRWTQFCQLKYFISDRKLYFDREFIKLIFKQGKDAYKMKKDDEFDYDTEQQLIVNECINILIDHLMHKVKNRIHPTLIERAKRRFIDDIGSSSPYINLSDGFAIITKNKYFLKADLDKLIIERFSLRSEN